MKNWSFAFVLIILIANTTTVNWQGTGNLTWENITIIRTYINKNFHSSWQSNALLTSKDSTLANLAKGLSD